MARSTKRDAPVTDRLALIIANRVDELAPLADRVSSFLGSKGVGTEDIYAVNLVLDEVITNIVSYGYPDDGAHEIAVAVTVDDRRITVVVRDDGRPFDPTEQAPAVDVDSDLEDRSIGGLGLFFVRQMMTSVAYRRDGTTNEVTLVRALPATVRG